ncbi:MAG: acyl-CoA dehydrogenase family protein [Polyangiaceae bacterium]
MANYFKDNDDLNFYVNKWIDWAPLVQLTERDFKLKDGHSSVEEAVNFYRESLEMMGEFVAAEVAPIAAKVDREGLHLKDGEVVAPAELDALFAKIKELGLHGLAVPREFGGMNAPLINYFLSAEMFARADASIMTHFSFHSGIAMAMLVYSLREGTSKIDPKTGEIVETRFADAIREITAGDAWGCMDITEANAGSDMAALRTKGEQDENGNWFVTGEKIFISSGHGKYHLVIARTEDAKPGEDSFAGLKGLSMFMVPGYEDTPNGRVRKVFVDRLEEKLGHHASATCALRFERSPAHLIGKRGEGFQYMLLLMNNARIGVGFESLGGCEAAYRMALEYAAQRRSMGKTIDRHEMIADYLDEMYTDIQGIRALAVQGAFHEEMSQKLQIAIEHGELSELEKKRLQKQLRHHRKLARRVTPLLKYLAGEKVVEISKRGIQIHGGVGYTAEYGAEKLLRDGMVMPIYEGTSQIQSLMAMKDTLSGILKDPQGFVRKIAQARWKAVSARDPLERRVAKIQALSLAAQQHLVSRTATDKLKGLREKPLGEWSNSLRKDWDPKHDFAFAMLHAERLTKILCDEQVVELLLEQAQKFPERREVLERYLERSELRVKALHEEITTTGERMLSKLAALRGDEQSSAAQ